MEFPLGAEERELKEAAVAFVPAELGRDLADVRRRPGPAASRSNTGRVTW